MSASRLLLCVWVVFAGLCLEVVPQMSVLILIALKYFQLMLNKFIFEDIPKRPTHCVLQVIFKYPLLLERNHGHVSELFRVN